MIVREKLAAGWGGSSSRWANQAGVVVAIATGGDRQHSTSRIKTVERVLEKSLQSMIEIRD